jgi:signal transduction histidine kinase
MNNIQNYFADIAENYIVKHSLYPDSLHKLSTLTDVFPENINLGIWTFDNKLIYDNEVDVGRSKLIGLYLPEIDEAIRKGVGISVRKSNFMEGEYAYYAKRCDNYIVRIAFPYRMAKRALDPDLFYANMIFLIAILFAIVFSVYHFQFRDATAKLKFFLSTYMKYKKFPKHSRFIDSELNEIERMFVEICNRLENNEKQMSEMTNNIAHELRTPVTIIRGVLETLIEYKNIKPEKKYDYLGRAYCQSVRLSEIIQNVIILSRTSEASHYFTLENVNIYDMIAGILEDIPEIIAQHNAVIDLQVSSNTVVYGNRTLLYSIFINLIINAIKYAGDNIIISIKQSGEDETYYYFNFYDNGNGVDEQYIDHIFDRFYRINEGRTRDKGGSGLGLAIVRDAIKFHHGTVRAENRPEGGLAFIFNIKKKNTEE